ncbi:EamA family transporter [Chitinimonas sp.]|uniref:EamA family transporter n=1 Tax=Chitinimonas sp. TaxID=1934313 RepID=UPI0035ADADD1
MNWLSWLLVATGVLCGSMGAIWLKLGANAIGAESGYNLDTALRLLGNWQLWLGLCCYIAPSLIWIHLLRRVDVSFVQPLAASSYAVTPLLAMLILHESVSPLRWLGIAVILLGVYLVAASHA